MITHRKTLYLCHLFICIIAFICRRSTFIQQGITFFVIQINRTTTYKVTFLHPHQTHVSRRRSSSNRRHHHQSNAIFLFHYDAAWQYTVAACAFSCIISFKGWPQEIIAPTPCRLSGPLYGFQFNQMSQYYLK